MPVILATWEAEAGELPEPSRRRLQQAEIAPLHCSPGNKSKTPSQKKEIIIIIITPYSLLSQGPANLYFLVQKKQNPRKTLSFITPDISFTFQGVLRQRKPGLETTALLYMTPGKLPLPVLKNVLSLGKQHACKTKVTPSWMLICYIDS